MRLSWIYIKHFPPTWRKPLLNAIRALWSTWLGSRMFSKWAPAAQICDTKPAPSANCPKNKKQHTSGTSVIKTKCNFARARGDVSRRSSATRLVSNPQTAIHTFSTTTSTKRAFQAKYLIKGPSGRSYVAMLNATSAPKHRRDGRGADWMLEDIEMGGGRNRAGVCQLCARKLQWQTAGFGDDERPTKPLSEQLPPTRGWLTTAPQICMADRQGGRELARGAKWSAAQTRTMSAH